MKTTQRDLVRTLAALGVALLSPALAFQDSDLATLASSKIREWKEAADIPGVSIAVVRDGKVDLTEGYGIRDAATSEPVAQDTVYQAASLSKPVFAYVVFRLVERGLLDLDTPLAEYLPYARLEHDLRYRTITARMVLSHTTGLPNWGGTPLDIQFDPGSRFQYSGEGYVYLQRAVESLSGKALNDLAREEAFEPLGMKQSGFVWRDSYEHTVAAGHDRHGRSRPQSRQEANAAASLYTTAADYARFVAAVMNGSGLSSESVSEMFRPQVSGKGWGRGSEEAQKRIHWALGWGIQKDPERGDVFWHWGDQGVYRCLVAGKLGSKDAIVYFTNSNNGLAIGRDVFEIIAGDTWALEFLGYEHYSEPRFQAQRAVERAYLNSGGAAGLQALKDYRARNPEVIDERFVSRLGHFLLEEERALEAIDVFRLNAEAHPESPSVHDSLGEALLTANRFEESLGNYLRALSLEPENEVRRHKSNWLRELIEAKGNPRAADETSIARYAGDYGPRRVRLRKGALYYQRDGNREYRLIPLTHDTFLLDGLPTFRLRFVTDGTGSAKKVVGIYLNGSQDETARTVP